MKILDRLQIIRKIERMTYEIAESNFENDKLYLLGINNNGYNFAKMLQEKLQKICKMDVFLNRLSLNPKNPVALDITVDIDKKNLEGNNIIVVDDVANTGRTLFYAMKIFMDIIPAEVETAVLVDRMHKSFPVSITYVGQSFATTIQDNIVVNLGIKGEESVYLEM
jgi:pyrimidine operon attenuation protein/uracil phosphoribosyltransferase